MRLASKGLLLTALVLELACGGGGGTGGVIGPSPEPTIASFEPEPYDPGSNLVTMSEATRTDDLVTVRVQVSNTSGLYGAGFNVVYDASSVAFVSWTAGGLLETGNNQVNYIVSNKPSLGIVVVNATRTGSEGAINVTTGQTLINLRFRVLARGKFPLAFENGANLYDAQFPSQPIPQSTWYAGALVGS